MPGEDRYHINPETGLPNLCQYGEDCRFGGPDFHYPNKHDAQVAWRARQLERGIIAYRRVMQAKETQEEEDTLDRVVGRAKGWSQKMSWSVVRSVIVRNISKYVVNFLGVFMAYAVASGEWLTEDWIRRLLPIVATILFIAWLVWFLGKFAKGSRKAARAVKKRRVRRGMRKSPTAQPHR
jgi:hypothetical protein